MKMAELSTVSGIAVATIKFYLRERLLPAGARTGPNQATYGEAHLRRLGLVRALLGVGGLSVADARNVIDAIDDPEVSLLHTFDAAQRAVSDDIDPASISAAGFARIDVITAGWHVSPLNPGRLAAARVVDAFEAVGHTDARGWFARYAAAALMVAEADLDEVEALPDVDAQAETVVVGTVLGDALFSGIRRAAQEHVSALRYGSPSSGAPTPTPPGD